MYFISYIWYRSEDVSTGFENVITNEHPIDWLVSQEKQDGGKIKKAILFWKNIQNEDFSSSYSDTYFLLDRKIL